MTKSNKEQDGWVKMRISQVMKAICNGRGSSHCTGPRQPREVSCLFQLRLWRWWWCPLPLLLLSLLNMIQCNFHITPYRELQQKVPQQITVRYEQWMTLGNAYQVQLAERYFPELGRYILSPQQSVCFFLYLHKTQTHPEKYFSINNNKYQLCL